MASMEYRRYQGQSSRAAHNLANGRPAHPEDADDALSAAMFDGWLRTQTAYYHGRLAEAVTPRVMELLDEAAARLGPVDRLAAWRAAWEQVDRDLLVGHATTGRQLWDAFVHGSQA